MNILGISAFYHDSAVCFVQDGNIVAAVVAVVAVAAVSGL